MVRAAIGLGSNLGDRARLVAEAVGKLAEIGTVVRVASLYETAPVGGPEQGPYLNTVAILDTEQTAQELLAHCLEIERGAGRERLERWGPRTLDLDILLYGESSVDEEGLTIPHPRMTERRFVLEPLLEAWPDAALPDGTPLASFSAAVSGQQVRRVETLQASRLTSLLLFLLVGFGAVAIWWIGDWIL